MNAAPIVLFVYNRPLHTMQTLEALAKNDLASESILYIYADGPKENADEQTLDSISETRKLIAKQKWCKEVIIIESTLNRGLADSILKGVTETVNKYGRVIVMEDDLVTSVGFLKYMNEALDLYERSEQVMHIAAYMLPLKKRLPATLFYRQASCWGWGTWADRWKKLETDPVEIKSRLIKTGMISETNIDGTDQYISQLNDNIEGRLKTWAILWHLSVFLNNGLCLHPGRSLVQNIGMDNSGIHCGVSTKYDTRPVDYVPVKKIPVKNNIKLEALLVKFYAPPQGNPYLKFSRKLVKKMVPGSIWEKMKRFKNKNIKHD